MKQQTLFTGSGECDDVAHARRTDPVTSHQAAASVTNLGRTREIILEIFKTHGPQTDEALIELYRKVHYKNDWYKYKMATESGIRTRRSELVKLGLVKDFGRGKTKTGRPSITWGLA